MSNEVVKYKNELNKFSFSGLTETEIDIIFAIFHKFKEKNSTEIVFQSDELKKLIKYTRKDINFSDYAFKAFEKIQNFKIKCIHPCDENQILSVVVFPVISLSKKERSIKVNISNVIADYLNAIENNFTRFELAEFVNLSSTYAKTLYRLLKQFRSSGWAQFEFDDFRQLLGIPETYKQCDIDKFVLKTAIKELQKIQRGSQRPPFSNLTFEKIKGHGRSRGGKVVAIKFTFDKQIDACEAVDVQQVNNSVYSITPTAAAVAAPQAKKGKFAS